MKYLIVILCLLSSGCTVFGLGGTKDIDTEKEEQRRIRELKKKTESDGYEPTPPIVKAASKDGITISVEKSTPLVEKDYSREVWHVFAKNETPHDKCVFIQWRLMDFEYVSDEASEFLLRSNTRRSIGTMLQFVYNLDGVKFTAPASGYVNQFRVRDPNKKAKRGDECLIDEKNIKTK